MIKAVGRLEAGAWFWTFMVLLSFVLLNMLIAIVMDAYSEVKDAAKDSETMWEEIKTVSKQTIGEHPVLRATIGKVLGALGLASISELVPLHWIGVAITARIHHLDRMKAKDEMIFQEYEEEKRHLKGGGVSGKEAPPRDPADHPQDYLLQPLTLRSMIELVHNVKPTQAKDLLIGAVTHYHENHVASASYEDILLYLRALAADLKELKHEVRKARDEPGNKVPEESYNIRDKVENLWYELRKAVPKQEVDQHPVHEDPCIPVKERIAILERELEHVRELADQELSNVSDLQWQISSIREDRNSMERAVASLQFQSGQLAIEKDKWQTRLSELCNKDPSTQNADATKLMKQLTAEQGKLHSELAVRGQRVVDAEIISPAKRLTMKRGSASLSSVGSAPSSLNSEKKDQDYLARHVLKNLPSLAEDAVLETPRKAKKASMFEQSWAEHTPIP
jgi:hypothetical protein